MTDTKIISIIKQKQNAAMSLLLESDRLLQQLEGVKPKSEREVRIAKIVAKRKFPEFLKQKSQCSNTGS